MTSARRSAVIDSSHSSIDPHGFHRKSSDPTRMSWRAGMHGNDPGDVAGELRRPQREPIQVRSGELGAAVGTEHVPVQRVEQDDHDVLRAAGVVRAVHRASIEDAVVHDVPGTSADWLPLACATCISHR